MTRNQAIALLVKEMQRQAGAVDPGSALSFAKSLRPVSWQWDTRDGSDPHEPGSNGSWDIGFLAQDLQQAQADAGVDLGIVDARDPDHLRIDADRLIPVLVAAVQEMSRGTSVERT